MPGDPRLADGPRPQKLVHSGRTRPTRVYDQVFGGSGSQGRASSPLARTIVTGRPSTPARRNGGLRPQSGTNATLGARPCIGRRRARRQPASTPPLPVLRGRHHPVLSPGREARPQPLDISVRRPRRHTRRGWVETLARPTKARPGPARRTNEKRVPGRPGIGTLPLRRASARGRPTQHSKETGVTTPTRTRSHTAHTQHTKRRQVQAHKREKFTLSPIRSCSMMASCEQASRTRDNTRTHRAQGRVTARGQAGSKRGDATQNTQMPRMRHRQSRKTDGQ